MNTGDLELDCVYQACSNRTDSLPIPDKLPPQRRQREPLKWAQPSVLWEKVKAPYIFSSLPGFGGGGGERRQMQILEGHTSTLLPLVEGGKEVASLAQNREGWG